MEKRTLTCINCPLGCQIEVILDGGTVQSISGNTCKRGRGVRGQGSHTPDAHRHNLCRRDWRKTGAHTVSCKTASDIPKEKIFAVIDALRA